jgi:putative drug exporter of the RND superfamily
VRALATWSYRHRKLVLAGWLLVVAGIFMSSLAVGTRYTSSFSLPNTDSTRALNLLQANAPAQSGDTEQVVVASANGATLNTPTVHAQVNALLAKLATLPNVTSVVSPYSAAAHAQMNASHTVAFANLNYGKIADSLPTSAPQNLVSTARSFGTPQLSVSVGGQVASNATKASLGGVYYGVIAAAVVLFLVFGSLLAMTLPLLSAVLALFASLGVIGMLSHAIGIASFSTQLVPLIGLGVGVDYALFIVTRFRQGLRAGLDVETAVVTSVRTAGRAVFFAGSVVCIALLGMLALGVSILNGVGIAASIAVLFTMATSLTLLPAMLGLMGTRVLSRRQRRTLHERTEPASGRWWRYASAASRRPAIPTVMALAVIGVLSIPFFSMRLGSTDAGSDPAGSTTRQAYDTLARGFGPGFNGPLLFTSKFGGPGDSAAVQRVVTAVAHQPGVATVTPPHILNGPAGQVVTIEAFPTTSPQAAATGNLIQHLRSDVIPRAEAGSSLHIYIGGNTATFTDFAHVIGSKMPLFVTMVVLLSVLLLAMVFRSIVIPLTAAVMNLFSAGAALGVLSAAYVWGWGGAPLGASRAGPIMPFLPVMVFAILFGLSTDYQVFLVSRIREEWLRTGSNKEAVRRGLAITGRTITAAAAIMILVFGSFILGSNLIIKEFGLALAVAVFVDAFIIRMGIVPAVMFLLGRSNWWFPAKLDRILPSLGAESLDEMPVAEPAEPVDV